MLSHRTGHGASRPVFRLFAVSPPHLKRFRATHAVSVPSNCQRNAHPPITLTTRPPGNGRSPTQETMMKKTILQASVVAAVLALPLAAHAQGTLRGAAEGAEEGGRAAGPLGAIVGGT